jgi:hypothetical protein
MMKTRRMQYLTVGLLIAAVVALVLTSTLSPVAITDESDGDSDAVDSSEAATTALSDLYVITASAGSLIESGTSGAYELTLEGVAEPATFFGDRPARDAGTESIRGALDAVFDPSLAAPNAALVGTLPDGTQSTLPMELQDPSYDAATATLSFTITFLDEEPTPGLSAFEFDPVDDTPTEWRPADLYIDSGYHNCSFVFRNDKDIDYTLGNFHPETSDRWGGGSPPASLPAHSSATVDFKFQADSSQVAGDVEYVYVSPTLTDPITVTMSWTCNYHTVGPVSTEDEECTSNDTNFYCTTYAFDGAEYFWIQNN